jgi:hypothetical protein
MARAPDPIARFARFLAQSEHSPLTIKNYRSDLAAFAAWFEDTDGEPIIDQTVSLPRGGSPERRIRARIGRPVRSPARRQRFAGRLDRRDRLDRRNRCATIDGPDRDRQGGTCRVRLATPDSSFGPVNSASRGGPKIHLPC